ncbi:MAG: homocysteine S-methyltransferase family protein [candidate division Zixibacteria bacterium]
MRNLLDRIKGGEVLICDGAMGTMLMTEGLKAGECPERINIENPKILESIARRYFEAGADIIEANTFGGSPLKLAQYSLEDDTEKINKIAVEAVRRIVGSKAYVAASCGPCGRILKPYGDTDPEEIFLGFKRQIQALIDAGIDMICVETMTDLAEATLAIKAVKSVSPSTPVAVTMTFDLTPNGFFTIMGNSIKEAAAGLDDAGADIIGSNCGNGIENMIRIAEEFKKYTSLPVLIQSNAGLPELEDGQIVYPETPEFMAEGCKKLLEIGVGIIGGCCGTTPEHITAFATAVNDFSNSQIDS